MREQTYTEEMAMDDAINEYEKLIRRKIKGLKTKVINGCCSKGLRALKLQFEWLEKHPNTELPIPELDYKETVFAWGDGIKQFESAGCQKPEKVL